MRMPTRLLKGAAALLLVIAGPTTAKSTDREQPADIEAGNYRDEPETGMRLFSDGFIYRQGTLAI